MMKIYLVGGAVRDRLLGRLIQERDWVVVGATVQEMLQLGFRQVGKDFPVFLHPKTHEEYALARTERKIGRGYTGFEFNTAPSVTLVEDLQRRDLTINAMAESEQGELIDPFHGQDDLRLGILRHVSPAFVEDPVRILRLARFAARFGFSVAQETMDLMHSMVLNGEVDALVPERVWKELSRALLEPYPEHFFKILKDCGALNKLFPEIEFPGPGAAALKRAVTQTSSASIRFAILLYPLTENQGKNLCARYRIPHDYRDLALLVIKYLPMCQNQPNQAEAILDLLQALDVFRRPERFKAFLQVITIAQESHSLEWLAYYYGLLQSVDISEFIEGNTGAEIGKKIREKRLETLKKGMR